MHPYTNSVMKQNKIKQLWNTLRATEDWEVRLSQLQIKHQSYMASKSPPIKTRKITSFFQRPSSSNHNQSQSISSTNPSSIQSFQTIPTSKPKSKPATTTNRTYTAPKQNELKETIKQLEHELIATKKYSIFIQHTNPNQYNELKIQIKEMINNIYELKSKLNKKVRKAEAQKRWRKGKRKQEKEILDKCKELGVADDFKDDIKIRQNGGRPRIEQTRSGALLAATMMEEAAPFTTTNPRRRAEENICNLTVLQLTEKVNDNINEKLDGRGKKISSSTIYNRTS